MFARNRLIYCHIALIALSNALVQFPFTLWGVHSTLGAFTYPLIFIVTDLTVRLRGPNLARVTALKAMLPACIISCLCAMGFSAGNAVLASRIALASLVAYGVGQLMDVVCFQRLRYLGRWWLAPMVSTTLGNGVDTLLFFSIAFYHCGVASLANHWLEIALVDMLLKQVISVSLFVPAYGYLLSRLKGDSKRALNHKLIQSTP